MTRVLHLKPEDSLVGVPVFSLQEGQLLALLVLQLGYISGQLLHFALGVLQLELCIRKR